MPRYYFDTDDGERQTHGDVGIDLAHQADVEREVGIVLQDLGMALVLGGKSRIISATVRDDQGETVCESSIVLSFQDAKR